MPQFDFFSFFVQTFWLILSSFAFYLIYLKFPISNSSQALKMRTKLKNFASETSTKTKSNFIYNTFVSFFK